MHILFMVDILCTKVALKELPGGAGYTQDWEKRLPGGVWADIQDLLHQPSVKLAPKWALGNIGKNLIGIYENFTETECISDN
jgi:hypothetical protein